LLLNSPKIPAPGFADIYCSAAAGNDEEE